MTVRLPRYQIRALEVFAKDRGEPVDALLARIVDQLTDAERARLSARIPGFAKAIAWPEAGEWRVRLLSRKNRRRSGDAA